MNGSGTLLSENKGNAHSACPAAHFAAAGTWLPSYRTSCGLIGTLNSLVGCGRPAIYSVVDRELFYLFYPVVLELV